MVTRRISLSVRMNKIRFELIIGFAPCTGREDSTVYPQPAAYRGMIYEFFTGDMGIVYSRRTRDSFGSRSEKSCDA